MLERQLGSIKTLGLLMLCLLSVDVCVCVYKHVERVPAL